MPKPTIEFSPVDNFALSEPADTKKDASTRILSKDEETGDKTLILYHPKGQEWGGENGIDCQAKHDYWEVDILLYRLTDICPF